MIYTVTFSPSLDYILDVPDFKLDYVNRTTKEKIYPGGKGINVSMMLNNLGIPNKAFGFTAGFTGETLNEMLEAKGVDTDFIAIEEGMTRINVKIRSDVKTEVNGQGPKIMQSHIDKLYEKLDCLCEDDYLILAGTIPASMPESIYMDIIKRVEKKNVKVVVDATGSLLVNVLPYKPFLVKPNHIELGEIFGIEIDEELDILKYAVKLVSMGARNVLVSMGGKGAVFVSDSGEIHHADAPKGIVKNTVGAGDSMVAGFVAGYIKTSSLEKAFKLGVSAGTASAFSDELATKEEIIQIMNKNFGIEECY